MKWRKLNQGWDQWAAIMNQGFNKLNSNCQILKRILGYWPKEIQMGTSF